MGGVGRVSRKDEVSPSWPSPMHSGTRGLQVDKDRFLYGNRSHTMVTTPLGAAFPVLYCAPAQRRIVLIMEEDSWRCASLAATRRIRRGRGKPAQSWTQATETMGMGLFVRLRVRSSTGWRLSLTPTSRLGREDGAKTRQKVDSTNLQR